jgi:hypothetical protein
MINLTERIAAVLREHGVGDECLVDWTRPKRLAAALVEELGLKPADTLTPDDGVFYVTKVFKDD